MRPEDDDDALLLAAYVDGVGELTSSERRRIEDLRGSSDEIRTDEAATRALIGRLRELPAVGGEPDWSALERESHAAVGPEVPRAWWRIGWRWLAPAAAAATLGVAMVAILLWLRPPGPVESARPPSITMPRAPAVPQIADADADRDHGQGHDAKAERIALWLDEHEVEVDPSVADVLGGVEDSEVDDESVEGLLPPEDLAWVDSLDGSALDRAEHWFERKQG